jgi:hypothetical protein
VGLALDHVALAWRRQRSLWLEAQRGLDVAGVNADEVLLLRRALRDFRSGPRPNCAPRGRPQRSTCPLFRGCERWEGPDDYRQSLDESLEQTERRRAAWPDSRLLDLLSPDLSRLG